MMSIQEWIIPSILLLIGFSIWGKKGLKNLFRTVFGIKNDFEEVKKEFEVKNGKKVKG